MFQVGDKVFYPMHGGGIVNKLEDMEVAGKNQRYYVMTILHRNMQVMVPVDNAERLGIRPVAAPEQLENALLTFHEDKPDILINDNQRHRRNMAKMKSGDICEGIEVIRDLLQINSKKKLGTAEKNMLENARQILISEVVLVKDIPLDQAATMLDQAFQLS